MKERPILFSAPMVRALIDGSKTQTRRVAKLTDAGHVKEVGGHRRWHPADKNAGLACPHGQPGDQLWVRESFWGCDLPGYGDQPCVVYDDEWQGKEYKPAEPRPWGRKFGRIPSIHMPRECSRITLEIVSVRVERLQDISRDDAMAEGIVIQRDGGFALADTTHYHFVDPRDSYGSLWESINGPGSWDANPWVWCVEFKVVKP